MGLWGWHLLAELGGLESTCVRVLGCYVCVGGCTLQPLCARGLPRPSPLRCACLSNVAPVVQGVRSPRNYHIEVVEEEEVGMKVEALTATVGGTQEVWGRGCGWVTI